MNKTNSSGLTLIELTVVVAIISVLLALSLPSVQQARQSARQISCQSNLRQVALAVQAYHSSNNRLPSLYNGSFNNDGLTIVAPQRYWDEYHFHSWQAAILPHVERSTVYDQIDFSKAASDPSHQQYVNTELSIYLCPSTAAIERPSIRQYAPNDVIGTAARTDYESIGGVHVASESNEIDGIPMLTFTHVDAGVWGLPRQRRDFDGSQPDGNINDAPASYDGVDETSFREVVDGLSRTIMIGEVSGRPALLARGTSDKKHGNITRNSWALSGPFIAVLLNPNREINEVNRSALYSFHPAGANVAFADGSVRLLTNSTDKNLLRALATRAGGE